MKKLISFLLLFIALNSFSQKEANVWYFGENAGIDFSTSPPTALTNGQLSTTEGCSSFSSPSGELLFYSDGINVFNKNHTLMTYSDGSLANDLEGNPSSTQSGMIIPKPGSTTIYYLFTVGTDYVPNGINPNPGFNYYTIDFSSNTLGEITEGPINLAINPNTNFDLSSSWSEKVTAVKGEECDVIWVLSFVNNTFYSYKITETGVDTSNPVLSTVNFSSLDKRGYLQVSPNGKKIAFADYNASGSIINGSLVLFDFDNISGEVNQTSSQVLIPNFSGESPYGVAFSQQSNKLYVSSYDGSFKIFQFDLESTDIAASKTEIINKSGFRGALQLGPDGNIYVSIPGSRFLDVIENPNKAADEIIYNSNAINLNTGRTQQGLPPFLASLLLPIEIKDEATDVVVNNQDLQFCIGQDKTIKPATITGNNITYEWFFDNGTTTTLKATTEILSLNNLTKIDSGKYTLTVKLTDDCGNTTQYNGTFDLEVFDTASAKKTTDINFCDTDLTTPNSFDLATLKNLEILDGLDSTIFNVKYYDTLTKATEGITGTELPNPYEVNTASSQTIYVRVDNKNAPNACFALTEFELEVTNEPEPVQPTVYRLCDDTASAGGDTDGITNSFRLSTKDAEILGTLSAIQYTVSYHTFLVDAQTSTTTNAIDKNTDYQVNNSQTIYVRVENIDNANCNTVSDDTAGSSFMSFQLIVDPLPIIDNSAQIKQCVNTIDGKSTINLTIAEGNVSDNPNGTFEYYEDQAETQLIANFTSYPVDANTNPAKIIWVKSISEFGCSRISELQLIIGTAPDETYNDIFIECDDFLDADGNSTTANDDTDGITWFYLDKNTIENNINTNTNITVFFYETTQDRDDSKNNIDISNYRNNNIPNTTGNPFPIYYKLVNNINNDCTGIGEFYLQIKPIPLANTPTDINLCDDDASGSTVDGENSGINLRDNVDAILGTTQTETDYIVSFHTSATGANTNTDIITNDTNFTNSAQTGFALGDISEQTIYVRVQDRNTTTQCFNDHVSFKIIVNPIPVVSTTITPFAVCDIVTPSDSDPRNRIAQNIDLTSKDTEILVGKINHRVAYYATQQDAQNGNEISNPTVFQNITNETNFPADFTTDDPGIETIFFKIFDLDGNMCESVFATFQLLIYPEPNIPINISDYSDCDNTTDSFADDANGINGDITLKNKIPEILVNYLPSEFADFSITFYTSLADAESGNTALTLNENIFENNANNQTIYVRIENTKNTPIACVHTGLSFNINIKQIPDFSVMGEEDIDAPQIVCLNDTPLTLEAENPTATYDYTWTDEAGNTLGTDATLEVTTGGKYTVIAADQSPDGCSRKRIIVVNESNIATLQESFITIIDESNNISSNDNISISIDTISNDFGIGDYQFAVRNDDNGDRFPIIGFQDEPLFENLEGGIYTIIVNDKNGCSPDTELQISVIQFPKFFTPNGDGKNDTWVIKGANKTFYPNSSINIFNRYGKLVAQILIDSQGWDGTYNGKTLPSDDYWFNVQLIPADTSKSPILKKGHFSLLRR